MASTRHDVPYVKWREYAPEDTVRFFTLRLQEIGLIKSTPQKIIAQGTDWRFHTELKKVVYLWVGDPMAGWGYWDLYAWHTMRSWYPYPLPKLLSMFVARQLPLAAIAALVFLAVRGRIRPLVPFIAVCTYFTLVYMLTWAEMRYSGPLRPLLAIILVIAGRGAFALCKRSRRTSQQIGLHR